MQDKHDKVTLDIFKDNQMKYDYEDFARDCYLFNELTGQADKSGHEDLDNQIGLIFEELKETYNAVQDNDDQEILDGCIDVLVTAIGLAQKLENKGFDVTEAMYRVAKNNLTKFVATEEAAKTTVQHYHDKGVAVYISKHKSGLYAVKRIIDDKLMKPVGYASVNLSDLV